MDTFHRLCFVDVSDWIPSSPEWQRLMRQLPATEQRQVRRFVFAKDQNLALASRLLQRHLIQNLFHVNHDTIEIERTPEGKPYWRRPSGSLSPPAWNYNVSHHGTIVAIASDAHTLVGVDVVSCTDRPHRKTSSDDFFRAFADHFNPREWEFIRGAADEDGRYGRFYCLWSLKEAYIKAVGVGLGFSLLRAEFIQETPTRWELLLDGQRAIDWQFTCTQVDSNHLVSVAYGPLSAMWKPETSSLFPHAASCAIVVSTVSLGESKGVAEWQQWSLQDLLRSS